MTFGQAKTRQGRYAIDVASESPSDTGPGKKFSTRGQAQCFPGNTVLCHLNQPGQQLETLKEVIAELRSRSGDGNISWLPSSSYHMTVFDGSLNARRIFGDWPRLLPLDASLDECNEFIAKRLREFDLGFDPPIRLVPDEAVAAPTLASFPLRPIDETEQQRLGNLRDRISEALGLRHANHDAYTFHITFGYYLKSFSSESQMLYQRNLLSATRALRKLLPIVELGAPEFCLFEDMTSFETQFFLKRIR